ncbi:MAG: hypothetical protein SH859_11150 [Hyphomicrobium aestuarii]|nr:hypothetical protein [Hyphomicrobium aestuarii]
MGKFRIEHNGLFWSRRPRLVASEQLQSSDFDAVATALARRPVKARKMAPVAGRRVNAEQVISTRWRGEETTNTALPGDWIVTSLDRNCVPLMDNAGNMNEYVIKADRFEQLYEAMPGETGGLGTRFRPKGVVDALAVPGGFDIVAPWGERQTGTTGYILRNGKDVYGNAKETFDEGYEIVED